MKTRTLIAAAGALLLVAETARVDLSFLGSQPAFAEKGGNGVQWWR